MVNFDTSEYDGWFNKELKRYVLHNKINDKYATFRKDLFERKFNKLLEIILMGRKEVNNFQLNYVLLRICELTKRLHGNL